MVVRYVDFSLPLREKKTFIFSLKIAFGTKLQLCIFIEREWKESGIVVCHPRPPDVNELLLEGKHSYPSYYPSLRC